jgi:purine-binding chemotaxis protein CheW
MEANPNALGSSLLLAVFSCADALFAVDALRVQEIIRVGAITPVHQAPGHVLGIINLRGRIVTILDPAYRMGFEAQTMTRDCRILIVDWEDEHVGLLVSRIHDMVDTQKDQVEAPPSNLKQDLGRYLSGVVKVQDSMVLLLDLQPLLSLEEVP